MGTLARFVLFPALTAAATLRARDCSFYWPAASGDTCESLASSFGISTSDFISYNPGAVCSGLTAGQDYCVEWSGTPPAPAPTTTPSSSTTTTTLVTTTSAAPSGPSPTQAGLTSACKNYYLVKSGDTCQAIRDSYNTFSLDQFYSWNPAIGSTCSGLWLSYYVCVGVADTPTTPKPVTTTPAAPSGPSPTQAGIATNCGQYYLVSSGDTCQGIIDKYRSFTLSQFVQWNPAVGSSCTGLWLGYYVCIALKGSTTLKPVTTTPAAANPTPTPIQSGMVNNCKKFAKAPKGGTCSAFASSNGVSEANLYRWNTVLGSSGQNCQSSFWADTYYCVGV